MKNTPMNVIAVDYSKEITPEQKRMFAQLTSEAKNNNVTTADGLLNLIINKFAGAEITVGDFNGIKSFLNIE